MKIYDKYTGLQGNDVDVRSRRYISPARVVWTSKPEGADIRGEECLLFARDEQISVGDYPCCQLRNKPGQPRASLLIDYGMELHGTVRIMIRTVESPSGNRANIRIRFGESAMEAMTELGVKNTTNDHANRDIVMNVGFYSAQETNESGFRFVRIDLLDEDASVSLKSVNAVFIFRDIDYLGSFECSDPLLNRIWDTAAYTVHLNMQQYIWDGIKRDRLVWIGDMHTEVLTILAAFGYNEVVPRSLDFARESAAITDSQMKWMNDMPPYSLWWILIHYDWYMGLGDLEYLKEQQEYMYRLLAHLIALVDDNGVEMLPEKFLDWPNYHNEEAKHAGAQALLKLALECGAYLMKILGEELLANECERTAERMKRHLPPTGGSKASGALLTLAGLADAVHMNEELLAVKGAQGFSTFLGYYILKAKALAGDVQGTLDALREYWGGMLQMGATTFWEDFNLEWMENAAPVDELVPEGKEDIHGDRGDCCYVSFRHSLCHGWASGPCPFLSRYILGVQVEEPGCRRLRIEPHLGDLAFARGTYPTPLGVVAVSHSRSDDGTIHTEIDAPDGVVLIC